MNWLHSILFGVISGFCEILPVSSETHQFLFHYLTGTELDLTAFRLVCRFFTLLALVISVRKRLVRFIREKKLAAIPPKRRKRQPDMNVLLEQRTVRIALIPVLLSFLLHLTVTEALDTLLPFAITIAVNAILLYFLQFFPQGNKDAKTVSPFDALVVGVGGLLAVVPGISRVTGILFTSRLRGLDNRFALELIFLLCIPILAVLMFFDIYAIATNVGILAVQSILLYCLAGIGAFVGSYFGIVLMRFLAVKAGYTGFSYYCWGIFLLLVIFYLTI